MTIQDCWHPNPARASSSHLGRLATSLVERGLLPSTPEAVDFATIHRWSVAGPAEFWAAVWQHGGIVADLLPNGREWNEVLQTSPAMAPPGTPNGPRWFSGARLNFAENLLRHRGSDPAIISWDEQGPNAVLSWDDLTQQVAQAAAALRALGVAPGDRVAGWLPNSSHAVIAMLATAAIGAVWTSCSPDFGVDGIVDRFGQTTPKVLFFCDGYRYGGKLHDCILRAAELLPRLPSVQAAIVVPWHGSPNRVDDGSVVAWQDFMDSVPITPLRFERFPFDHPLFVLYSSGTTGLPKCMVHGAGGTLLQLLKEHQLHVDLHVGDRLFYFTTCGWMMWNWMVAGLASGATLVLYDGAPLPAHEPDILWRMAAAEGVNVFGTSAKYLATAAKQGLVPKQRHELQSVRSILSTGSPLLPPSFDWIWQSVGDDIQVASISGGTDIVSCFVLGNPLSPVYRGEIQGPGLGMAVEILDAAGNHCAVGEAGELVCTKPFPSMPVAFWNDPDGSRYRAAYFERFPGVWCHGDWITRTAHDGFVISGRSDATLNPGGVRIGTAEIYRQVESLPEILESLVIGQRIPGALDGDVRVVLFVQMRPGISLTDELCNTLRRHIRQGASPHHVPKVILEVADIPRTRSGKLSELAVRDLVEGRQVTNIGALANPESLEHFRNRHELQR